MSRQALKSAAASPWLAQDSAYQRHHFTCRVCIAAGKGFGSRCAAGAGLWAAYTEGSSQ